MTDDTRDVLEMVIVEYRHAPNPVFVRAIIAALAAEGLVIVPRGANEFTLCNACGELRLTVVRAVPPAEGLDQKHAELRARSK